MYMHKNIYIDKKDFGYSVAISDVYALIGNPSFESFNSSSANPILEEGSVDVYKYNSNTSSTFIYDRTIKLSSLKEDYYALYTENNTTSSIASRSGSHSLSTETNTSGSNSGSIDIFNNYEFLLANSEDMFTLSSDFGRSLDIYENLCAIGCTRMTYTFLNMDEVIRNEEGCIEIHDLSKEKSKTQTIFAPINSPFLNFSSIDTGSNSFGWSVSINKDFLVVGSPYTKNSGSVFIFKRDSDKYNYHSYITSSGQNLFGSCLKLDKNFNKLIVGNGSIIDNNSKAYLYEYVLTTDKWELIQEFTSNKTVENLKILPVPQHDPVIALPDGYGNSVSIYCSSSTDITVAVGAPYDRIYKEFSGSNCYRDGCVYVYDLINCELNNISSSFWKETKLFGDEDSFKFNRFGHSVDISEDKLLISCPKFLSEFSSSYVQNTLFKSVDCDDLTENDYLGMFYIYDKQEENWNNIYAKFKPRKRFGYPFNFFAHDVSIHKKNLIVGSPIALTDSNRIIEIVEDKENVAENLHGNFSIFNLNEFESHHHVGNVFYRSGKMVFSNSASVFDNMFNSDVNDEPVYDISYNSKTSLYEKQIICTVSPGEFNYSTNPTAHVPSLIQLDLNKNGKFDFQDCDKILRGIYKKFTGGEDWWNGDTTDFINTSSIDSLTEKIKEQKIIEKSLFQYYVTQSMKNETLYNLTDSILTTEEYNYIVTNLDNTLDINQDGFTDNRDLTILWKYFADTLTADNYEMFTTNKSTSSRSIYSVARDYLDTITGKSHKHLIKDVFHRRYVTSSNFTTQSLLSPYITTIGLYNNLDLIGVAKLGTPIKNEGKFPLNFIIRFDI